MKRDDKIMVNWPTGKDGPYTIISVDGNEIRIKVFRNTDHNESYDFITVNRSWCEPAEPEIEEGRLYWIDYKTAIKAGNRIISDVLKDPVHRRWDELENREKRIFTSNLTTYSGEDAFKLAYRIITGEEHP